MTHVRHAKRTRPPAAGPDLESAALVGGLLRGRRLDRGLTVEDVGSAIRVAPRHIAAVEEGRFADLPPQPYARGLISAYALLVGLEPDELLRVCGPSLGGEGAGQSATVFRYPLRERFTWREWTVPAALAAAVVTFAIARAVLTPPPVALEVPAAASPAQLQPAQLKPPRNPDAQPDGAAAAAVEAPGVRVLLRCEGTTWAEAAPDGGELRRYELGPGQNLELTARERLSLDIGDAGVVRIRVGDRELGFIGYKGETKVGLSFTAQKPPPAAASPDAAGD